MKKSFLVASLVFFLVVCVGVTRCFSIIIKSVTIFSKVLNKDIKYTIYLPPKYYIEDKKYPSIYLFHGLGGDENEWIEHGHVDTIVDNSIRNDSVPPVVLIMPNADPVKFYYINDHEGKGNWEDMFYNEFIPYIEKFYRVKSDEKFRGIAGVSMGGYGALLHAIKYPQYYCAVAAFSPAIRTDQQILALSDKDYNYRYGFEFGMDLKGKDRFTDHYRKYDILSLIKKIPKSDLESDRYYVNCGLFDSLLIGSVFLHFQMKNKELLHILDIGEGGHNWNYWELYVFDAIKFITNSFNGASERVKDDVFFSWLF